MATEVLLPKQGNTVESCIILEWKKREGDAVSEGEPICEVETDKATFEVEAPASGTLVRRFFDEGDDVPVLTVIAAIGDEGEDVSSLAPKEAAAPANSQAESAPAAENAAPGAESTAERAEPARPGTPGQVASAGASADFGDGRTPSAPAREAAPATPTAPASGGASPVSPRARLLARAKGVDPSTIAGTGPGGRVIERDIRYVLGVREPFTPAAIEEQLTSGPAGPARGTGIGGRVTARDVTAAQTAAAAPVPRGGVPGDSAAAAAEYPGPTTDTPVKGIRKLIAERMHASLQTTAQLTLNSSADAREILAFRKKLKDAPEKWGYGNISLNDIMLYAVARTLPEFPDLNSHFLGDTIRRFENVHLGFAVDTKKGLMVPVIRNAHLMTLKQISEEAKRLIFECVEGGISPDELKGGTFTVTNLGAFGIESFTPIVNAPEVCILGLNNIQPKPVTDEEGCTDFIPHIGLSLTIDHQLVDGALGAKFLKRLGDKVAKFEILLAG